MIRRFHQTCTREVAEFDGYVANFFGDCVLAYFGWPRAHEDDAERAVRAGLALARCMVMVHRGSGPGEALSLRVGIATGAVVVGELMQEGPAQEQSAVGLAPNLGARILGLAAPGQVAIDELTRRLLAPSFTVQALGRHALKGIAEPVAAYLVSGERPAESRFDARKGQDLAADGRARPRARAADGALGAGARRRRPGGVAGGRGGHRQVAPGACAAGRMRMPGRMGASSGNARLPHGQRSVAGDPAPGPRGRAGRAGLDRCGARQARSARGAQRGSDGAVRQAAGARRQPALRPAGDDAADAALTHAGTADRATVQDGRAAAHAAGGGGRALDRPDHTGAGRALPGAHRQRTHAAS